VADDDRAIRESSRALQLEGHDVAAVPDGVESLTLVRRETFDALMLDVLC
jgi:two-component system response regulator MprA